MQRGRSGAARTHGVRRFSSGRHEYLWVTQGSDGVATLPAGDFFVWDLTANAPVTVINQEATLLRTRGVCTVGHTDPFSTHDNQGSAWCVGIMVQDVTSFPTPAAIPNPFAEPNSDWLYVRYATLGDVCTPVTTTGSTTGFNSEIVVDGRGKRRLREENDRVVLVIANDETHTMSYRFIMRSLYLLGH